MNDIKPNRIHRWMLAGTWTGLIYSTLYIVRPICQFFKQFPWFSFSVNTGIAMITVGILLISFKKKYIRNISTWFFLFLILAGYLWGIILLSIPEERLHLIEYGILSFLVYWALILDLKKTEAYFGAFIITSLIGWGDEGIQYLLPNRYYQFKDVCLNSISAALGLAFVYVICRDRKAD